MSVAPDLPSFVCFACHVAALRNARSSSLLAPARVLYLILISDHIISQLPVYVGKCSIIFGCVGGCHSGKHLFASNVLVLAALCDLLLQGDGNASHAK